MNWTATGADLQPFGPGNQQRVVFTSPNAVVQANFKGIGLSNQADAYNTNSQRKSVKAQNGSLLNIYESLGKIWLEKSNDNGQSWIFLNSNNPIEANGKSPSIDYIPWTGTHSWIGGVYYPVGNSYLKLMFVRTNDNNIPNTFTIGSDFDYANNLAPVVAITSNRILVAANGWYDDYSEFHEGLVYFYGEINLVNNNVTINWFQQMQLIPDTKQSSKNPTIVADKNAGNIFHIAWQEGNVIKYLALQLPQE